MQKLGIAGDMLFAPILGRSYISEGCPQFYAIKEL